jgi:putative ABC transport system substrate-binding protein
MRRREFIAGLGSAAAWPAMARAQQQAMPVIGYLSSGKEGSPGSPAFLRGLAEQGYVDGRNVEIAYLYGDLRNDRLPGLAAALVRRRVTVIFAGGRAAAVAAKSATVTIPIVFNSGADPIELGLVASLNRPGGNATGVSFLVEELTGKRLELLHEIAPAASLIGFLMNPTLPQVGAEIEKLEDAARILGVHLVTANASTPSEIEAAFENLAGRRIGALMMANDPLWGVQRDQITGLAARHALPAIYVNSENVEAGGLISYGASVSYASRLAGTYVGRILKGEKPADLPVQQITKIDLVINLKTAKALGLTIPEMLLATADQVIQ